MTNESSDKDPRKTWDTIGEEDPYCGTGGPTRVLLGSDGILLGQISQKSEPGCELPLLVTFPTHNEGQSVGSCQEAHSENMLAPSALPMISPLFTPIGETMRENGDGQRRRLRILALRDGFSLPSGVALICLMKSAFTFFACSTTSNSASSSLESSP